MTRMVKIQLVLFTILGLVAMLYAGAKYARLPRLVGLSEFPITVQMPE